MGVFFVDISVNAAYDYIRTVCIERRLKIDRSNIVCQINSFAQSAMDAMKAKEPRTLERLYQVFALVPGFQQKFEAGLFFFSLQTLHWAGDDYQIFFRELGTFLAEHGFIGATVSA